MSTSLMAAPDAAPELLPEARTLAAAPPVALTEADADRISAAISAARTESTRRVYAYTWGQWARWCAARNLSPLPSCAVRLPDATRRRGDRRVQARRGLHRDPARPPDAGRSRSGGI